MMKIGFIGTGNMGGALASAAARSGEVEVLLANRTKVKAETLAERIGAVVSSNEIVAREADHIFLGVKPQMIVDVLKGIAPALKERKSAPVLISMVTGLDIARIQELAGGDYPVIRIMPNMPAAVGEGVIFYACSGNCDKAQQEEARLSFEQTLLNAGSEVNNALVQYQTARDKSAYFNRQVGSLENAARSTQLLMKHGNTTYLEVLTAQQTLLNAQLSQVANRFTEIQGVITLYQALGGGRETASGERNS